MASSESASSKRRRDDVDPGNKVDKRTRGMSPPSPSNPASGRDVSSLVRDAMENGIDSAAIMRECNRVKRESRQTPSDLTAFSAWFPHQEGNEPKYLCHRPQHAVPPVPVVLLFKPLSQFADNLNTIPIGDEDLSFAQKFWDDIHSVEYVSNHMSKVVQMVRDLQNYCKPSGVLVVPSYPLLDGSVLDGVGLDKLEHTHCMWLEYKAESGKSGDPYFQVLNYALRCDAGTFQTYGIAVCVSGPQLQTLAVTVVGEKVWADPLGIFQCYGELEALEATARVWAAVRRFSTDYRPVREKYAADAVPWPLKEYRDLQRMDGKRLIYIYTNEQGQLELAKFAQNYCEEAHIAWRPHAPEIRGISTIVGHWRLVRMEYLSDQWCPVAEILKGAKEPSQIAKIRSCIVEVVKRGHAQGFVHGDVRLPNILVCEGAEKEADGLPAYQVKLLDFDWSGKSGEAKYSRRLNTEVDWPAGVTYGALISEEHDIWFASHLEQQLK